MPPSALFFLPLFGIILSLYGILLLQISLFYLPLLPLKYGFSALNFISFGNASVLSSIVVHFFAHAARISMAYAKENIATLENFFAFNL
jgi:hypothetical protein